jgi:hypothetical protein
VRMRSAKRIAPALPQKRTSPGDRGVSVLGHLLPRATQQTPSLFDHFVGAHQRSANGTPYVDKVIFDRFNVALRCPVIPESRRRAAGIL